MGTKLQHKMYLSEYYPIRDLNDSTRNSNCPQNKTFGHCYGAQQKIDVGYDKEQVRQTIVKHEMVFRQQVHELHRLYKRQADMMNEARFLDKNRWHDSSNHTDSIVQSQLSCMKIMESKGSRSMEFGFLESKHEKLQRRLFAAVIDEGPSGGSICNGDALSSCLNMKTKPQFTDLNEPVQFEEASGTASVDIFGNITSSIENMQRQDLSSSSCSPNLVKQTSRSLPSKAKDDVHTHFGSDPPYDSNLGQSGDSRNSLNGGFGSEYLPPAICESSENGSHKAEKPDLNRREQSTRKPSIFGVEISETSHANAPVSDSNAASGQATQLDHANNNAAFPKSCTKEAISDSQQVLVDDRNKVENLKGGLPWLRNSSLCNGKYNKERGFDRKILGIPVYEKFPEELCSASSVKPKLLLTDLNCDPSAGEVSVDCKAKSRDCIDLNVTMADEDHFSSTPKTKIALDINLEARMDPRSRVELFTEGKLKEPFCDSMRFAADVLVSISSFCDSLHWFAEVISSYDSQPVTDSEDSVPNGVDYFEHMTLKLSETKLEECHYEGEVIEVASSRRPRRGQARRGRQRKDFQRDVLPGIVSLSRNDITEDLQTLEGLVRATGGTWLSGLSNSSRGRGRGRKRVTTVTPSQPELPCQLRKCELTGWGKRTRRPPRQRCLINHSSLPLQ